MRLAEPEIRGARPRAGAIRLAPTLLALALCASASGTEGFSAKTAPTVTAAQAKAMGCRYFIELLGLHNAAGLATQLDPIAHTEVDTVVCAPMAWRFYNFPSTVDRTWQQPDRHPRNRALFSNWQKMVDHLAAGGDPLRDALAATRRMGKAFVVSFRMNDNHYVHLEDFPTHNDFWREHPKYRLGDDPKPYSLSDTSRVLDYLVPEVREFYFSILEELVTKYDVDGIELDFQRAPRFFHDRDLARGRGVMTAHVQRIRRLLDEVGSRRGRHLQLWVRALPTVEANFRIGADVAAWARAGWLDGATVSSSYIQTADVGIEDFRRSCGTMPVYGELNFVHLQLAGTGHNAQERRYVTAEAYRAATLSYLERGARGVSYFNTYCIPQPQLGRLITKLLVKYKDIETLRRSDKDYTTYATAGTMFGKVFPARNENTFAIFVADEIPGQVGTAVLRFETRTSCADLRIEAALNGTPLRELARSEAELFPPVAVNAASPKRENLKLFTVPVAALRFGINQVTVRNVDAARRACDFTSSELALYMKP